MLFFVELYNRSYVLLLLQTSIYFSYEFSGVLDFVDYENKDR